MTSGERPALRIRNLRPLTESEKARMKELLAPGVAAARAKRLTATDAGKGQAA